jgi:branched-chain amino acid transport system substrate-binding protein
MNGLVLRSLALTGLALALIAPAAPAGAADPYNIDVILNLTGPGTFLGKAEELSISLLEKRINASGGIKGRPVHFVIHDDQTQPSTTIQLMTQSIADKAPVVLGSSLAANCLATFPLVKAGPVQYCYSPSVYPPAGTFGFTSGTATKDVALAYVRFFRSKGWKRMAMISSTDASGQDADESFAQALALPENKDGVTMISQQHFGGSDLSVLAQIATIKSANPQVLVAYAPGTPFGTLLKGIQQASLEVPVVTGTGNMSYAEMKQYADVLPKDLYFPGAPVFAALTSGGKANPAETEFINAFKSVDVKPDQLNTFAWDSTEIAISALKSLGTSATPEQVRAYIAGLTTYDGVLGRYDFKSSPQRGLDVRDVEIVRWDAGKQGWTGASDLGGFNGR